MPDRDFDPKDGEWFYFMNQFADALARIDLSNAEYRFLFCIIRHSWGYGKSYCLIRPKTILSFTGLAKSAAWRAEQRLLARNILKGSRSDTKTAKRFKINSKISTWKRLPNENRFSNGYQKRKKVSKREPLPLKTIYKDKEIFLLAQSIIDEMNLISGKNFTYADPNIRPILERLEEGFSQNDCIQVLKNKWADDEFHKKFYQPKTLFKAENFEGYLNENHNGHRPHKRNDEWFVNFCKDVLRSKGPEEALRHCKEMAIDPRRIGLEVPDV